MLWNCGRTHLWKIQKKVVPCHVLAINYDASLVMVYLSGVNTFSLNPRLSSSILLLVVYAKRWRWDWGYTQWLVWGLAHFSILNRMCYFDSSSTCWFIFLSPNPTYYGIENVNWGTFWTMMRSKTRQTAITVIPCSLLRTEHKERSMAEMNHSCPAWGEE